MSTTEPSADKLCRYHSSNTPARRAHDLVRIADTHQWGTEITTEVKTDKQHVQWAEPLTASMRDDKQHVL